MTKITYEIVEHDGGWAYRVDGVFSETFSSHDMARRAADLAGQGHTGSCPSHLASEINRWAPIINAAGENAD